MNDQPTPSYDVYNLAQVLAEIRRNEPQLQALYDERDTILARLATVIEHTCMVRTVYNTMLVELICYSDKLTARLVTTIYGTDLPVSYSIEPSHDTPPDVPLVSVNGLDTTEAA